MIKHCYIKDNAVEDIILNDVEYDKSDFGLNSNIFKRILFKNIADHTNFIENIAQSDIVNIVNNTKKIIYTIINSFNVYTWDYNCLVDWSYRYPVVININGKDKILKDEKRIINVKFTDDNGKFIMGIVNECGKSIIYLNEANLVL